MCSRYGKYEDNGWIYQLDGNDKVARTMTGSNLKSKADRNQRQQRQEPQFLNLMQFISLLSTRANIIAIISQNVCCQLHGNNGKAAKSFSVISKRSFEYRDHLFKKTFPFCWVFKFTILFHNISKQCRMFSDGPLH